VAKFQIGISSWKEPIIMTSNYPGVDVPKSTAKVYIIVEEAVDDDGLQGYEIITVLSSTKLWQDYCRSRYGYDTREELGALNVQVLVYDVDPHFVYSIEGSGG